MLFQLLLTQLIKTCYLAIIICRQAFRS